MGTGYVSPLPHLTFPTPHTSPHCCRGPTWEVDIGDAGHFQFLDQRSPLQRAVCPEGGVSEDSVRRVSQVWGVTYLGSKEEGWAALGGQTPSFHQRVVSPELGVSTKLQRVLSARCGVQGRRLLAALPCSSLSPALRAPHTFSSPRL